MSSRIGSGVSCESSCSSMKLATTSLVRLVFLLLHCCLLLKSIILVTAEEDVYDEDDNVEGEEYDDDIMIPDACTGNEDEAECQATPPGYDPTTISSSQDDIWVSGLRGDIYAWLECEESLDERVFEDPHRQSNWRVLHEKFASIVGDSLLSNNSDNDPYIYSGFQVPTEVKIDKEWGRGLYATDFIPKGTLVWKSVNTAGFQSSNH